MEKTPTAVNSEGVVYSFTMVYVGFGFMAERAPYMLSLIEFPDQRILPGLLLDAPDDPSIIGRKVLLQNIDPELGLIFRLIP
jgi:uncharacterized protein